MNALRSLMMLLVLAGAIMPGEALGVVIYRFGGASLPPPPEVGRSGVRFVQKSWSDPLVAVLAGESALIKVDEDGSIGPLEFNPKQNIAPVLDERDKLNALFDRSASSIWISRRYLCAEQNPSPCREDYGPAGTIDIDLGRLVFIDRIELLSGRSILGGLVRNVRIHLPSSSESFPTRRGAPLRTPFVVEVRDNSALDVGIKLPEHTAISSIQLVLGEHNEDWGVREVRAYARGFAPRASYRSNIIDFGRPAAVGALRWSGTEKSGAKITVQTRSGSVDEPFIYWKYTGLGDQKVEVTRAAYGRLWFPLQAGRTFNTANWTSWPAPYELAPGAGSPSTSATPHRYFQFKLDFTSSEEVRERLEFLEFRASVPVASGLVGEISPVQVNAGETSRFTYVLKPTIQGSDAGFDALEMKSRSSRFLSVDAVRMDDEETAFGVEAMDEHGFEIRFPRLEAGKDSDVLLEVVFEAQVLRYGASFNARVFDSSQPLEVPQEVIAGDASDEFDWDRVFVATSIGIKSLLEVNVRPRVFTPNGDGVNDRAIITYEILETTRPVPVKIELRNLAGRLIRRIHAGEEPLGHHERSWDGTDGAGEKVPPGVYIYRVSMDTDVEQEKVKVDRIGTVYVVY